MFYYGKEGLIPLLATVHIVNSGLLDGWLGRSSIGSTKDLWLSKCIVLSMRQSRTMTYSLVDV